MPALHDIVRKGSTDRSVVVSIIDSTTGVPETAVVFDTAGIDLWYRREGAARVAITEATLAALTTAHTDGGFLHISDGDYRLDLPDAAFASGANYVDFGGTVTGMIVIGGRVRLVDINLEDAVRGGMTALPNAAADAAGGLPISDAGGLDLDNLPTLTRDKVTELTTLRGTVSTSSTTTSITTSAMTPATSVADQLKGRIVVFDRNTTTAALRGQATDITASSASATPTLTVTALTNAPASGDTFTIV
jgi:hypothetical protein